MKQGFVTIATGDERYYKMARTLLRSYRQTSNHPMPFAIIADQKNKYTEEFDDVVILKYPQKSWMDKMELLNSCPYDENIFIDADCIIYHDINFMWNLFANADDFSCFGKMLPLDSKNGWFTNDVSQIYQIHFITHLHGMLYFIRNTRKLEQMYELCQNIIENYDLLTFNGFNEILADEPVYALMMAILNLKPIERKAEYYCFVPFATSIKTNYYMKKVSYSNPKDGEVNKCFIVHWGNTNTEKYKYKFDDQAINLPVNKQNMLWVRLMDFIKFRMKVLYWVYKFQDIGIRIIRFTVWVMERLKVKIFHMKE